MELRRSPTLEIGEKIKAGSESKIEAFPQQLFEDFNPSSFDQNGPIDLAGELGLFDNIEDHFAFNQALQRDEVASADEHHISNKKRAHIHIDNRSLNTSSISVEPLREKGLPTSLCDLVFNMFDCSFSDKKKSAQF